MRAFIAAGIGGDFDQALNFYATAIDVLERSRKHWQEFPEDQQREMFDDKFVLAVRGLYLYTFSRVRDSILYKRLFLNACRPWRVRSLKNQSGTLYRRYLSCPKIMSEM